MSGVIFVILLVMMFEVVARYLFNSPTSWTQDIAGWSQVFYIFIGAVYAMYRGYFVRVDALFASFPARAKILIDTLLSTPLICLFLGTLTWKGGEIAHRAFKTGETTGAGTWDGVVWPAKAIVPFGSAILLCAWFIILIRRWRNHLSESRTAGSPP